MVQCLSFCPSVCPSYWPLQLHVLGLLLWARRAGDIDQLLYGWCLAASVLPQAVGDWTWTCSWQIWHSGCLLADVYVDIELNWIDMNNNCFFFSAVLWHCWLGVRKSIRPVKIEWWGVGVIVCLDSGARCWLFACGPADATVSPKPIISCLVSDWFYLSGTSLPRLSWKRGF